MVQILVFNDFSLYDDDDTCYCYTAGWNIVYSEEKLDLKYLKYFVDFYGKENVRLRCGFYD